MVKLGIHSVLHYIFPISLYALRNLAFLQWNKFRQAYPKRTDQHIAVSQTYNEFSVGQHCIPPKSVTQIHSKMEL